MAIKKLSPSTLRRHKGLSFVGVTTCFICHDGQGRVLLAKRSQKTRDEHGHWDVGGGGLKFGQTVEGNLRREIKEEYGVDPKKVDFLGYLDVFREAPDGQPTHWLAMFFVALVDPAKVRLGEPEMIDEIAWFKLDDFPPDMHSQWGNFLRLHGDRLRTMLDQPLS